MLSHPLLLSCLEITLWGLSILLLLPVSILTVECVAALTRLSSEPESSEELPSPRVTVLVPAHNEAAVIEATLNHLVPQLQTGDRLIVIADNCSDHTATVAQRPGVTVLERHNPNLKGKGYALDFALQGLTADPPDVVIVVDADCEVEPGAIARLAHQAHQAQRPVQATYLMDHPQNPGVNDLISALALKLKNLVRPLGLEQLGLPCLLMGSGMALPWPLLSQVSLAGSKTVDDVQLAIDLAIAGYVPQFAPEAHVTGRLMQQQAAQSQRSRWEHGHLEVIVTQVPPSPPSSAAPAPLDFIGPGPRDLGAAPIVMGAGLGPGAGLGLGSGRIGHRLGTGNPPGCRGGTAVYSCDRCLGQIWTRGSAGADVVGDSRVLSLEAPHLPAFLESTPNAMVEDGAG